MQSEGKIKNSNTWLANDLRPYLKNIIQIVAKGAYKNLKSKKQADKGRFELLGMDVILDDNLHPWLTEVQVGPGISRDPGIKNALITQLIEEMFSIVLEVDVSKRHGLPLSAATIKNARTWEVVDVV